MCALTRVCARECACVRPSRDATIKPRLNNGGATVKTQIKSNCFQKLQLKRSLKCVQFIVGSTACKLK